MALAVLGVVGKKVARGPGWKREDVYLGVEFTLAGVSAALLNIFEFLKPVRNLDAFEKKLLGANVATAFLGLILFTFALSMHQDYGGNSNRSRRAQLFWLAFVSNVLGFAVLVAAIMVMPP